jgi:hypothetical protein
MFLENIENEDEKEEEKVKLGKEWFKKLNNNLLSAFQLIKFYFNEMPIVLQWYYCN